MFFCKKCKNFSATDRCGFCGAKRLRAAEDNDPVFLAEIQGFVRAGMFEGALEHNNIPFIKREKHGGALKYMGYSSGREQFYFYVPYGAYEKSKQIYDEIFNKHLRLAKKAKSFMPTARRKVKD